MKEKLGRDEDKTKGPGFAVFNGTRCYFLCHEFNIVEKNTSSIVPHSQAQAVDARGLSNTLDVNVPKKGKKKKKSVSVHTLWCMSFK